MTTKNKVLFALVVLGLVMMGFSLVGAMWIGFSVDLSAAISVVGELLMLSAAIVFIGPAKFFKGMYLIFVSYMVYECIVGIVLFESILTVTLFAILALLLLISLIPVVFKQK